MEGWVRILVNGALFAVWFAAFMFVFFRPDRVAELALRPFRLACSRSPCRLRKASGSSLRLGPTSQTVSARHTPSGLVIYTGGAEALGVRFQTRSGEWKPDIVSRRIVRDAIDQMVRNEVSDLARSYMAPQGREAQLRLTHQGPTQLS
jgi:hypothetical protein